MSKIDRSIEFIEENYIMINSLQPKSNKEDMPGYILKQLKIRKKEIEREKNNVK